MNRPLPPGDGGCGSPATCWASGRAGIVSGAGGLVAGTAAAASGPTIGHRWATFGPRSLAPRRCGQSQVRGRAASIAARSGKARRGRSRAGQEARVVSISPFAPAPGGIWHPPSMPLPSRAEEARRGYRGNRAGPDPAASATRYRAACGRFRRALVSGWFSPRPMLAAGWWSSWLWSSWHLD